MGQYKISEARTGLFEGYYANNKKDVGGETFAGISRVFHPKWNGWPIIDRIKAQLGLLTQAAQDSRAGRAAINAEAKKYTELQSSGGISLFYKKLYWDVNRLDEINDQQVCDAMYDLGVNGGTHRAAEFAQRSYNDTKPKGAKDIEDDGAIGNISIAAINSVHPAIFHTDYVARRRAFHRKRVEDRPDQSVHLTGWLNRCKVYVF